MKFNQGLIILYKTIQMHDHRDMKCERALRTNGHSLRE